jgi:hypothetical protein
MENLPKIIKGKLENICSPWKKNIKFNKSRAFNKDVGPG